MRRTSSSRPVSAGAACAQPKKRGRPRVNVSSAFEDLADGLQQFLAASHSSGCSREARPAGKKDLLFSGVSRKHQNTGSGNSCTIAAWLQLHQSLEADIIDDQAGLMLTIGRQRPFHRSPLRLHLHVGSTFRRRRGHADHENGHPTTRMRMGFEFGIEIVWCSGQFLL